MRHHNVALVLLVWVCGCSDPKSTTPSEELPAEEQQAVAAIEHLGGIVVRDKAKPGQPVVSVILTSTEAADGDLKDLKRFKSLNNLALANTKVTDAGLKELTPLKGLTSLTLLQTKVTDAGVHELQKALPNCKILR